MAKFLNTTGNATLAIGICDRCSRKFPLDMLRPDPNFPGLRVCDADRDHLDPYRLPARQAEDVTLKFPRPDIPIATNPEGVISEDGNYFLISEDGNEYYLF